MRFFSLVLIKLYKLVFLFWKEINVRLYVLVSLAVQRAHFGVWKRTEELHSGKGEFNKSKLRPILPLVDAGAVAAVARLKIGRGRNLQRWMNLGRWRAWRQWSEHS